MRPQGPGGQIGRTRGGPGLSQSGHRGWQKVAQQWPQPHPCRALSWAALSFPSSWGLLRPPQDILSRAQSLVNKQHCQQTGPQQARERCQDSAECAISPTGANSGKGDCQNPPLLSSHKSFPLKKKKNLKALLCPECFPKGPHRWIEKWRSGRILSLFSVGPSLWCYLPATSWRARTGPHQDTAIGLLFLFPRCFLEKTLYLPLN